LIVHGIRKPIAAPARASSTGRLPAPRRGLVRSPRRMPGRVMTFGRIWCSASMTMSAVSAATNTAETAKPMVSPRFMKRRTNSRLVAASTRG